MPGPLLNVLNGHQVDVPPVWFMRQAGRYLPEYRALRADRGGFLDLVYDTDAAAEVTVQPIERYGFDGAILFSDILIVPYALGQKLEFLAGEGPRLSPPLVDAALSEKHRGRCRHGVEFTEGLLASTPGGSAGVPAAIGRNVDGAQECAV